MPAIEVNAPIAAVTVYADRAQVTRRGTVALPEAGAYELTLGGLPAAIDADSLRAAGRGSVAVTIIGVESKVRYLPAAPHETTRELQQQLQSLQDADRALERREEALLKRLGVVQLLADNGAARYARALAEGQASLESAAQLLDFISAQMAQVQSERAEIEKQRRENAEQQAVATLQLGRVGKVGRKQEHLVAVAVESQGAGEFELELIYSVRGASWQPLYDVRVAINQNNRAANATDSDGTLTLGYGAMLSQQTGEDWTDVTITLSTARPGLGSLPPKLDPIYVDIYAPPMAMSASALRMRKRSASEESEFDESVDEMLGMMVPEAAPAMMEAEAAPATVQSQGATVTFQLPRPLSVPSDGQPHRATVAVHEFPSRLDFLAVSRRVSLAYLRATVANNSGLTLLAGRANVFRDGEFVGATFIEAVAPGQEFKLFLGPDEQVRAERQMTGREVEKNLMGNVRRHAYAYSTQLENLKNFPARVTVLDQVPVSRNETVKVKVRHAEPSPHTDDLGVLRWELTLPPGGKQTLRYDYTVESPRDSRLTGLED